MAYNNSQAGPSAFTNFESPAATTNFESPAATTSSNRRQQNQTQFDFFEWYPDYQSCHTYFLDHAQHTVPIQALAAFVNITLPYQRQPHPILSSTCSLSLPSGHPRPTPNHHTPGIPSSCAQAVSLVPYIRRLIATGHDFPGILHGLFGDRWEKGIGPLHEIERRNYLFAAKSGGWASVKAAYDMPPNEFVPFLQPLRNASEVEVQQAEESWSEWLKMVCFFAVSLLGWAVEQGSYQSTSISCSVHHIY